ncbi:MAG: hypothetical protein QOG04_422, partial [Actinomycetota bacterium]|nr:hypothetical protein [Actinomycetota bacterium]
IGVISTVSEGDDPTITIIGRDGKMTVVASSSVLQGKVFS